MSGRFGRSLLLLIAACGDAPPPPAPPTLSQVQADVFKGACLFSNCHIAPSPQMGLDLSGMTHSRIVNVASREKPSEKLVAPGDPDASFVMDKLLNRNLPTSTTSDVWGPMPKGGMLEPERIELVRAWIAAGAKDD